MLELRQLKKEKEKLEIKVMELEGRQELSEDGSSFIQSDEHNSQRKNLGITMATNMTRNITNRHFTKSTNRSSGADKHRQHEGSQISSVGENSELTSNQDISELESKIKYLYSQFFSNEQKLAQDKIRNKNQIFKNLYQLCLQDLQAVKDHTKEIRKENAAYIEREVDAK